MIYRFSKKLVFVIGLALALNLYGQINLRCSLDNSQILRYAPVKAKVALRNNSGQVLLLDGGRAGGALQLEMERTDGRILNLKSDRPLVENVRLVSGGVREFEFELTGLFELTGYGTYRLRAVLELGSVVLSSPDVTLLIIRGFELARLRAGVAGDISGTRLYVLEYMQTPKGETLYLRIEDDRTDVIYGVFELGQLIRSRKPELLLDEATNVHVLFQSKNMLYVHKSFTPYGVGLETETISALPRGSAELRQDDAGRVVLQLITPFSPPKEDSQD